MTKDTAQSHSARVKAGLAAARARGVKLGGDRAGSLPKARALSLAAITAKADARASELRPLIRELQAAGIISLNAIAIALNTRGVPTARNKGWSRQVVSELLKRIEGLDSR